MLNLLFSWRWLGKMKTSMFTTFIFWIGFLSAETYVSGEVSGVYLVRATAGE